MFKQVAGKFRDWEVRVGQRPQPRQLLDDEFAPPARGELGNYTHCGARRGGAGDVGTPGRTYTVDCGGLSGQYVFVWLRSSGGSVRASQHSKAGWRAGAGAPPRSDTPARPYRLRYDHDKGRGCVRHTRIRPEGG